MKRIKSVILLLVLFFVLAVFYYIFPVFLPEVNVVYVTIMIFLFATLAGFFISRQANRYNQIVLKVTEFDGCMSSIYRNFEVLGEESKKGFEVIAKKHYKKILSTNSWDSYFLSKSNTLTSLYNLFKTDFSEVPAGPVNNSVSMRIIASLESMQKIRKNMIALYQERIPTLQWYLIGFLVLVLFMTISSIPSAGNLFESILKSAFITALVSVVIMLKRLNAMTFFEELVGKSSGRDVLDIIEGKR